MNSIYLGLKMTLVAVIIAVVTLGGVLVYHLDSKLQAVDVNADTKNLSTSVSTLNETLTSLKTLLTDVNTKLTGSDQAVLPTLARTTNNLNITLTKANTLLANADVKLNGTGLAKPQDFAVLPALTQATRDIRQSVTDANSEQKRYYTKLSTDTDEAKDALLGPTGTVTLLNTNLTTLNGALGEVNAVTTHLATLSDPTVPGTLANNLTAISASVKVATADAQVGFHKWLHPTKLQVAVGVVQRFALAMIAAHTVF